MSNSLDPLDPLDPLEVFENSNTHSFYALRSYVTELKNKVIHGDEPDEWRSTPNLEMVIETNGKGKFRCPITLDPILPKKPYKNNNRARLYRYIDHYGNSQVVSLQKFVALIYHPNLYEVNMTNVIDGNKDNLHKSNIEWYYIGGRKY